MKKSAEKRKRGILTHARLTLLLVDAAIQGVKRITLHWHRKRLVVAYDGKVKNYAFHYCTPDDLKRIQRSFTREGEGHILTQQHTNEWRWELHSPND